MYLYHWTFNAGDMVCLRGDVDSCPAIYSVFRFPILPDYSALVKANEPETLVCGYLD